MDFEITNIGPPQLVEHRDQWVARAFIASTDYAGARVHLEIEIDEEHEPACRRLAVEVPDEQAISGELLRQVPVRRLVRAAVAAAAETVQRRPDEVTIPIGGSHPRTVELPGRGRGARRRRLSNDELERVADIYREAVRRGDPPKRAVADELGAPESTAGRWVMKARERGLLGRSLGPGRAGEEQR